MNNTDRHLYEFGAYRLDAAERLLLRAGEVVPLTPKAFDLLLALVGQAGHLQEKEALLKAVWPDCFVEENNLADNISKLRKALGEGENGEKFIETIPKRGYRFVAGVRAVNEAAAVVPPAPAELAAAPLPEPPLPAQNAAQLRLHQRPEVMLIACGLLALLLLGVWLYQHGYVGGQNAEAQQLEFKGHFYIAQWTEPEVRKGIEQYQRAITLAPRSATAHAGLASAWIFLSGSYASPREAMPQAKAAATRALQLDETEVAPHVSLAVIKMQYDWDWAGAESEFKRALQIAPDYGPAHILYGSYLIAVGRMAEAQAEMKQMAEADALSNFNLWNLGLSFYFARHDEQAIEQYRRAAAVDSRSYWPHLLLAWAYTGQGRTAEAIAAAQTARRLNDCPQTLATLGYAHAKAGQRAEAQKALAELQDLAQRKYVSPYDVAMIYAGLEEREQTLAWLEKAYEDHSGRLALWLKVDPKFDDLRADNRFRDLLRRVGHAN